MNIHASVVSSVAILVALICFAMLLRRLGVLKEEQGPIFARLITHVTLPALIFVSLMQTKILWSEAILAFYMLIAEIICLVLGWFIARMFRLDAARTGAVVLATGFGSSSLLGYALINQVFPNNSDALTEAVIISELGVVPAFFTLGVMIAIYYGSTQTEPGERFRAALKFFKSPIFVSVAAGLLFSFLVGPIENPIFNRVLDGVDVVGSANTFIVALTVGLLLHFKGLKEVVGLALLVCLVKLVLKPVMLWLPTLPMDLMDWQVHVLILEASMPSAMLTAALCSSYGCDGKLASKLVFATTIVSIVTIPIMFEILT
jgi:malate permease and related proteins